MDLEQLTTSLQPQIAIMPNGSRTAIMFQSGSSISKDLGMAITDFTFAVFADFTPLSSGTQTLIGISESTDAATFDSLVLGTQGVVVKSTGNTRNIDQIAMTYTN